MSEPSSCRNCFHSTTGECYIHEAERLRNSKRNVKTVVTVDEFVAKYGIRGASRMIESYIMTCHNDDIELAKKLGEMTSDLESALRGIR